MDDLECKWLNLLTQLICWTREEGILIMTGSIQPPIKHFFIHSSSLYWSFWKWTNLCHQWNRQHGGAVGSIATRAWSCTWVTVCVEFLCFLWDLCFPNSVQKASRKEWVQLAHWQHILNLWIDKHIGIHKVLAYILPLG